MRLRDDVRKSVVFIGTGEGETFESYGTAFLTWYKGTPYLVTSRHTVEQIGDDPCVFRVNSKDGPALDMDFDPLNDFIAANYKWLLPSDNTVDVAALLFRADLRMAGADARYIPESLFIADSKFEEENVGVGDFCYTVGLFHLLSGKSRNLPFVHTGHIGMLPGDEKIPVKNWRVGKNEPPTLHVEGYLIETNSLGGLSGSPVFVRASTVAEWVPQKDGQPPPHYVWPDANVMLLGVWQGSWEGDPEEILRAEIRDGAVKVPVGIGVVVPTSKLIELLDSPEAEAGRKAFHDSLTSEKASKPD